MRKTYLNVDYKDRDLAKRLGARWDPSVKKWYCEKGSPLATVFSWRAAPKMSSAPTPTASNDRSRPVMRQKPVPADLPLFA